MTKLPPLVFIVYLEDYWGSSSQLLLKSPILYWLSWANPCQGAH